MHSLDAPRSRLACIIAAILACFASVAPASAQSVPSPIRRPTAPEIQRQTLERIDAAIAVAQERMDTLVDKAIDRLQRAADRGASPATLERAAAKFKRAFPAVARRALAQINRDIGGAMIRMRSADDFTRELEQELAARRERAIGELRDAIAAAEAAIDQALAEAAR